MHERFLSAAGRGSFIRSRSGAGPRRSPHRSDPRRPLGSFGRSSARRVGQVAPSPPVGFVSPARCATIPASVTPRPFGPGNNAPTERLAQLPSTHLAWMPQFGDHMSRPAQLLRPRRRNPAPGFGNLRPFFKRKPLPIDSLRQVWLCLENLTCGSPFHLPRRLQLDDGTSTRSGHDATDRTGPVDACVAASGITSPGRRRS